MAVAYLWHALLEFLEEQGILDHWFESHIRLRRAVFTVGAALLLVPATFHASEFWNALHPIVVTALT
jgi:hypothetical protein